MHTLRPLHHRTGWPRWALWSCIPVALSMGFIAGMALATYLPSPSAAPGPSEQGGPTQTAGTPGTPQPPKANQPAPPQDSSWKIPNTPLPQPVMPVQEDPPVNSRITPGPQTVPPEPVWSYQNGPPRDVRMARSALTAMYAEYTGAGPFSVEYQQMRHAGLGTSLVGLLRVDEYEGWATALQREPEKLQRWLESAARLAQPAAERDHFHLSWAVVEVRRSRPAGFADAELTPLSDGSYLILRPLASTVDHTKEDVSLRPLATLTTATAGRPVNDGSPWATYGPVLRFDESDLYRPSGLTGTRPRGR